MGGESKKEGNARKEAISAETGRKNFDGKLPVISKTKEQSELISGKLFSLLPMLMTRIRDHW